MGGTAGAGGVGQEGALSGAAGEAGTGGAAVIFTDIGGALTVNAGGSVTGGAGGTGGLDPSAGGVGVAGPQMSIVNAGTITGGLGSDGITHADALDFVDGTSTLTLSQNGVVGTLVGDIGVDGTLQIDPGIAAGRSVTLANLITDYDTVDGGAGVLEKIGAGTLVLSGANTYSGGTTLAAGVLDLAALGAAGSGSIDFSANSKAVLQVEAVALTSGALDNPISGFAVGDEIALRGVHANDTVSYSASTGDLKVMNGQTLEATLHLGFGYGSDLFVVTADTTAGGAAGDTLDGSGIDIGLSASAPPPSGGGAAPPPNTDIGTANADLLTANAGGDTVLALAGDDTITGATGHDILYGNAGADIITLLSYTDASTVYGGQGDDVIDARRSFAANFLSGDLGNDSLVAGSGADTLYGGSGDDTMTAGAGHDQIYGNAGNDHIVIAAASGAATVYGGQGDDLIDASASTHANFISADLGNDTITLGSGPDTAYGGGGDDTIFAGSGHDQFYGNAGNDTVTLSASNAGSTVYGGQGNDLIDASASTHANYISGDLGDDMILAGSGGDIIHGGAGSDTIQAASGGITFIHVGVADSSALSTTGASQLDHVTQFGPQTKLVFDGDPAATVGNTVFHGADTAIIDYAAAYAYAYGDGAHAAAVTGVIAYAVVSDSQGHVYVFAADHAAVEIDGLASGVDGVTLGQVLAA